MRLRHWLPLMMLPMGLCINLSQAAGSRKPTCMMQPRYRKITFPKSGFTWLADEEMSGKCDSVPAEKWIRTQIGPSEIFVYMDGPSGSGRYWNITVGVAPRGRSKPEKGVCFTTSTVGWRTLQRFSGGPLPWLEDVDHDGRPEFIIWGSFPLSEEASEAEFGLVAWVYRLTPEGNLALDWKLSRRMAQDIAENYWKPLENRNSLSQLLREKAGTALQQFANEGCEVPGNVRTSRAGQDGLLPATFPSALLPASK